MHLFNSDLANDVRAQYLDAIRRGVGETEATKQLIADYGAALMDEEDAPNFWGSLAEVQWESGRLEEMVKHNALICLDKELERIKCEVNGASSEHLARSLDVLKQKLSSQQPPKKPIKPYHLYHTDWKVGDVFAYRLNGGGTGNPAFDGMYAYFVVNGTETWYPGHLIPVVYVYWTMSEELLDLQTLKSKKYLPQFYTPTAYANNPTMEKEYSLGIICTSARSIPQKRLINLGNAGDVKPVENEETNHYHVAWKKIDEYLIRNYVAWNGKTVE